MEEFITHVIIWSLVAAAAYDFFILGEKKLTEWKELRSRLANDLHNRALHAETLAFLLERKMFFTNAWRPVMNKEDQLGESEAMGMGDLVDSFFEGFHGTSQSSRFAAEAFTLAILGLETNRSSGEAKEFVLKTGRIAHKFVAKDHKKYYTEKVLRNEIEARYDPNAPPAEKSTA